MKPWNKTAARAIPVVVAVVLVAHLAATWAARFPYPFDLEWMEGGMLAHSWRLQHGLPIYTEAGREFIPFIYPAGYASVLAALGKVFGLGYELGRAVSLAGTLAAAGAIVRIVRHHGGSALTGLLGAAMFLGCYRFSGAFYDLVRLDGLYIGLLSWAVALGLERRRGALEASALLLAAAFLVKQHCAVFGIPMALGIWTRDGWVAALRFALFAAVPALLVTGLLQWRTDGHYLTYVYSVPALHHLKGLRAFPGTPREAAHALPILLPLAAGWVAVRTARHSGQGGPIVLGVSVALAVAVGVFTASLGYVPGTTRSHPVLLSLVGAGSLGLGTAAAIAGLAGLLWHRRREWRYLYGVGVAGLILVSGALMRAHVGGFLNVHIQMHWVIRGACRCGWEGCSSRRSWATSWGSSSMASPWCRRPATALPERPSWPSYGYSRALCGLPSPRGSRSRPVTSPPSISSRSGTSTSGAARPQMGCVTSMRPWRQDIGPPSWMAPAPSSMACRRTTDG
jgi:hypothetical protein